MNGFWEQAFQNKKEMWGQQPAQSALLAVARFVQEEVKKVLIPGIGYGRNASVFREAGLEVTGIEISPTAIDLARQHLGKELVIHQGSVTAMPFDSEVYDGIFCHGLLYLLDAGERRKMLSDCYAQLAVGGLMVFSVISKTAASYGQGTKIGEDRYEQHGGVQIYFYDRESIQAEFSTVGLMEIIEVVENMPFYLVSCRK